MNDEELLAEARLYEDAKAEVAEQRESFLFFRGSSISIEDCLEIATQVRRLYDQKLIEFYNTRAAAKHQAELERLAIKYPQLCLCNFDGKHPDRTHLEIARVQMHDRKFDFFNTGGMVSCTPYPEYWYRCIECGKEWNPAWRIENGKLVSTMRYA